MSSNKRCFCKVIFPTKLYYSCLASLSKTNRKCEWNRFDYSKETHDTFVEGFHMQEEPYTREVINSLFTWFKYQHHPARDIVNHVYSEFEYIRTRETRTYVSASTHTRTHEHTHGRTHACMYTWICGCVDAWIHNNGKRVTFKKIFKFHNINMETTPRVVYFENTIK